MSSKKLQPYVGPLSLEQVVVGMNACLRNGKRLVSDAELLLVSHRYASAVSLAVLAIEEAGKLTILRDLATAPHDEVKRIWREFRSHTRKNALWVLPEAFRKSREGFLEAVFDPKSEHPELLDAVKQIGLYVDCLGNQHWSDPQLVVSEDLARSVLGLAKLFTTSEHEHTVESLQRWVSFMGPARATRDPHVLVGALMAWEAEEIRLGFRQESAASKILQRAYVAMLEKATLLN